jgi:hypothetical protein
MSKSAATTAISRGLEFLARHQLRWGQFNIDYAEDRPDLRRWLISADHSPFATSHIVYSLTFSQRPHAKQMINRAIKYFCDEMVGPGLWRHWNKSHPRHSFIPPDLDDIACISYLLQQYNIPIPDNKPLFFINRNARGLYYTYLIPRLVRTFNLTYWQIVLGDLNPGRAYFFWTRTPASRGDVDAVVNANILLYLGERPETQPIIDWLIEIVQTGREASSDSWYLDPFTFYYAVARCYWVGIFQLERVRDLITDRILKTSQPDGRFGENEMQTALAINTLLSFGMDHQGLQPALSFLIQAQRDYGAWRRYPYYFGGPKRPAWWGSEELTTGLCIEALTRSEPSEMQSNKPNLLEARSSVKDNINNDKPG